jgi:hypothetical protein
MAAMPIISNRKVILSAPGLILKEGTPQATGARPSQRRHLEVLQPSDPALEERR